MSSRRKQSVLCRQNGQTTIEAILLVLLLFAVFNQLTGWIEEEGVIDRLVTAGAWSKVVSVIENGYIPKNEVDISEITKKGDFHPNSIKRHVSYKDSGD